jgi:phosphatidate cytidylyltransferase
MTASHPETPAVSAAPRRKDRAAGRAGRNLVAAIGVGVGLGAVVLSSLLIERHWFIPVVALAAAVGTWELAGALRRGADIRVPLPVLLIGGQAMVWLVWPFGPAATAVAFAATALGVLLWRMPGGAEHYVRDVTAGVFTAAYVPLLCAFAALMVVAPDGAARVLVFMICVVASDVGGYTAGVLAGKHPMAPTISPKKSWEGFGGSITAAAIGSALVFALALHAPFYWGLVFGAAISVVAVVGDLAESMLKRDLGIKDMSHLLPGHGGLMDRLDSILFAVPTAFLLLSLLASSK